jgi:hypothetical protein
LNRTSNVSAEDSWPTEAYLFQWERWERNYCDAAGIAGYEILQGDYGQNNFTSGVPLWLQPFGGLYGCGGCECSPPSSYIFKPLSVDDIVSGTFVGSWTGPPEILNSTSAYSPFAPGGYTVVAGDEWGQVAILHFIVAG